MIADPGTSEQYRVIDVHQHLTLGEGTQAPIGPRLEVLDQFGIDRAVLLPPSGAFGGKPVATEELNAFTSAVANAHPDRFLCGVAHVDVAEGPAKCARALDQAVSELGLRGVAWHHRFQGAYLDHPAMPQLLRQCAELGVPALVHLTSSRS